MKKLHNRTGDTLNRASVPDRDPYRRLAAVVLLSGYKEVAEGKTDCVKRKARHFFISGAFQVWADMAHLKYDVVMRGYRNVLSNGFPSGDARRARYRKDGCA